MSTKPRVDTPSEGQPPLAAGTTASARDLLADRRVLFDTVLPPLVFVTANAVLGLVVAALAALTLAAGAVLYRLWRRQRLMYALSGLGGVALAVGFALVSGTASGFFVPGILTSGLAGLAYLVSVFVRRPLVAVLSAAIYRWPLDWYWHPKVRPAYSEITLGWAALYLAKAALQVVLVRREAVGWLAAARIATGWPAFALLILVTYAYVNRRLAHLGGPSVDQWREGDRSTR